MDKSALTRILESHLAWVRTNGRNGQRADLRQADLRGVNLRRTNLNWAKLSGAKLSGADLHEAHLDGANLSGADLRGANLHATHLDGALLGQCKLFQTVLSSIDLSKVGGLENCTHDGPSPISTDTLYKSEGTIPEAFLRGCGLHDWEIEATKLYARNLAAEDFTDITYRMFDLKCSRPILFFSVFISHNHQDKSFARRLHDALQTAGIRCWLDEKQMLPGDDIYEHVDRGIKHWDKLLLCASKNSLVSWWVDLEMNKAFEKERQLFKERGKKVLSLIPLDLDGHLFDKYDGPKGDEIRSRIAADFTDDSRFDAEVERVIRALRADDGAREPVPPKRL